MARFLRQRPWRVLFIAALGLVARAAFVHGDQPAETLPGFRAENVFQAGAVDNVNVFSGDPGVVVPLGPEYVLGPSYSWQMKAYYSNKFWTFSSCSPDSNPSNYAWISGDPAFGVGWALQPGYVVRRGVGRGGFYFSPDGGRHSLDFGTGTIAFSRDGTHLRAKVTPDARVPLPNSYTVEYPDGSIHTFDHPFMPQAPGASSPDFTNAGFGETQQTRYGLSKIEDRFRNKLLQVNYSTANPWQVTSIDLTPDLAPGVPLRTITFAWKTQGNWKVIDYLEFPAPAGAKRRVTLGYTTAAFARNNFDNSNNPGGHINCPRSAGVSVPQLTSITFSDPAATPSFSSLSYWMAYFANASPDGRVQKQGALQKITLPTQGWAQYDYDITAGQCIIGVSGNCDPDADGLARGDPATEPLAPNPATRFSTYLDKSPAVVSRTQFDPIAGVTTTTTYERKDFFAAKGIPPEADSFRIVRRVFVTSPGNDGGAGSAQYLTRYHFHTAFTTGDELAPDQSGGIELLRQIFPGTDPGAPAVRSTVSCWGSSSPKCGFRDAAGAIHAYSFPSVEAKQAAVTWFGAVPAGADGGVCTGSTKCIQSSNSAYVANAGAYKTNTVTSNLASMAGWTSRVTTTNWTPLSTPAWIMDVFDSKSVQDNGSGLLPPSAAQTSFTFDPDDGYLTSSTTTDPTHGTLTDSSPQRAADDGLPSTRSQAGSGGVATTTFTDTPSFQAFLPLSVQRTGIGWKSFDVLRDSNSGLITTSRDPNPTLATTYAYDALGRLKTVTPPSPRAPTSIGYPSLNETTLVRLSSDSDVRERYLYDGFGRLVREIRNMPFGFAFRARKYDSAGHAFFVSEWKECASETGDCRTAAATFGTTMSNFDPFERAQTITRADGKTTTISRSDGAISFSDTLESVTVNVSGTNATTVTRKDPLGRAISVTEPTADVTTYTYNVLDKLAKVTQGSQTRSFVYDEFGFLRSEQSPEKWNPSTNAAVTTTYSAYNALGDALDVADGGGSTRVNYDYIYDPAGRLLRAEADGNRFAVNCYDGATTCDGSPVIPVPSGHVKGRRTRAIGWNYIPTIGAHVIDDFAYASTGLGSLTSHTTTTGNGGLGMPKTQSWTYNKLGLISGHTHPSPGFGTLSWTYTAGLPNLVKWGFSTIVSDVTYNPSGGLASYKTANQVTTTIQQDASLIPRPARISAANASSTLFDTGLYAYDGAGNITGIGTDVFGYDSLSRLTAATESAQARTYTYDRYGNIAKNGGYTYTHDARNNHLTPNLSLPSVAYDTRGNLTTVGSKSLRYDAFNRQVRNILPGTSDWTYLFNSGGERVIKFPSGSSVPRREMARYITEANDLANKPLWTLSPCTTAPFADVPATDPDCSHVKLLSQRGVTAGCGAGNFCPNTTINRAEMAVFIVKGYRPDGASVPACTGLFSDVSCTSGPWMTYAPYIEQLHRDGITAGCQPSPLQFCPGSAVSEWETLVWLATVPGSSTTGTSWAAYHPVPRGSTFTYRDEQNRVITEAIGPLSGAASATTVVVRDNVYLGNLLVASYVSNAMGGPTGWQYYSSDHLGSIRLAMLPSGNVTHKYWPYGEELPVAPPVDQRITFAGMERDTEANHFYDHARTQDFNLGRFVSADLSDGNPTDPQSWNRFSYASSNPLKYVDPTGMATVCNESHTNCNVTVSATRPESSSMSPGTLMFFARDFARTLGRGADDFAFTLTRPYLSLMTGSNNSTGQVALDLGSVALAALPLRGGGVLSSEIARTFRGGAYRVRILRNAVTALRYWGGKSKEAGSFLTTARAARQIGSAAEAKALLNLPAENTAELLTSFTIPAGTRVFIGRVEGGGAQATQVFIESAGVLRPLQ